MAKENYFAEIFTDLVEQKNLRVLHFLDYMYTPVKWSTRIYKCELKGLGK